MIKIGKSVIGKNLPCYIIAEAGVNHNGELYLAKELVKQAKLSGADCVKFQTFKAEQVITRTAPKARYQLDITSKEESQFEMLKKLELQQEDYIELINYCKELNIDFLSTPYNHEDAEFLENIGVGAYKIASGQLVEYAFLEYVAQKGKPMIVSTGMAKMSEVAKAVEAIRSVGNENVILLHCTTNYPSATEDANVKAIESMKEAFKIETGYSDHVANNYACYAAVALGAKVIEKHFTLDRNMDGPDHSSSLNPEGFKQLVEGIKAVELSLGSGEKMPCDSELENINEMRRSIATTTDIKKGEIFSAKNIGFKRPATGIAPVNYNNIIGQEAKADINSDILLEPGMIDWK